MTQPGSAHRISLSLDTRIALESLVLNRLQRLPETRREEWLRGLVIGGFRVECQAIKDQQSKRAAVSGGARLQTPFSHWLTQGPTPKQPKTHEVEVPGGHLPNEPGHRKPFATLRKVIG
tara:strand:- start:4760 stop:5116 length:357 start_codon:yes stop_codon:yes gene_type:complete